MTRPLLSKKKKIIFVNVLHRTMYHVIVFSKMSHYDYRDISVNGFRYIFFIGEIKKKLLRATILTRTQN